MVRKFEPKKNACAAFMDVSLELQTPKHRNIETSKHRSQSHEHISRLRTIVLVIFAVESMSVGKKKAG
jgi:hypothetical protein